MAEYKSRYAGLGFYVNGELKTFNGGRYVTEDKDEIAVLDALTDAERVDKAPEPKKQLKQAEEKAPTKPARKTSAK